jgi:hypothetical protein
MPQKIFFTILLTVAVLAVKAQTTPTQQIPWTGTVATDQLGRQIPTWAEAGEPRDNRWFGLLFSPFPAWNNRHGTFYDVNKFLEANPYHRKFEFDPPGPLIYPNWTASESWAGYYHGADPWIIRKQLVDMATAGFEYIFWDFTNGAGGWNNWNMQESENWSVLKQYLEIGTSLQQQGVPVPRIAVWLSTDIELSMEFCYNLIYAHGKYDNMIFYYRGKPLLHIMAGLDRSMPDNIPGFKPGYTSDLDSTKFSDPALLRYFKDYFTFRLIWDLEPNDPDYRHVWNTWGTFPAYDTDGNIESYGTGKAVGAPIFDGMQTKGTTAVEGYNLDISNYNGQWLTPDVDKGLRYERDWRNAHASGAPMVLSARYNEWWAACWKEDGMQWLGKPARASEGEGVFIDKFNPEFSGDLEPMKGLYADNYYWQTAGHLRIHKGVERPELPGSPADIIIDGNFDQWSDIKPVYYDAPDDLANRDFRGNPVFIENTRDTLWYKNYTARNDFIETRVAYNDQSLFFYAKTKNDLTPSTDLQWMVLLIDADLRKNSGWEGYDLRINYSRTESRCDIEIWDDNSGIWNKIDQGSYRYSGNELEMDIPRYVLGNAQKQLAFDFKWCDNCFSENPDIMDFWEFGDVAPQTRLNYRFSQLQDQRAFGGVPRNLPGIIEAETYNNGDAGIAYHDNTPKNSGWAYNYRNHPVDMDYIPDNKGISVNTDSGEWLSYLVYVSEEAFYTPVIIASAQRNGTGIFKIDAGEGNQTGNITFTDLQEGFSRYDFPDDKLFLTPGLYNIKVIFENSFDFAAWGLEIICEKERLPYKTHIMPGTFQAEDYDEGCNGIAYYDAFDTNFFNYYRNDGVDIDTIPGGYCVADIVTAEWLEYTLDFPSPGIYSLELLYSSTCDNNRLQLLIDGAAVSDIFPLENTGSNENQTVIQKEFIVDEGKRILRIYFVNADRGLFLDQMTFSLVRECNTQKIKFSLQEELLSSEGGLQLNATASSGLPVSFHIEQGPAAISNENWLELLNYEGNVEIKAFQIGNHEFCPDSVYRNIGIIHDCAGQVISYGSYEGVKADSEPFLVEAYASSGLPVTLEVVCGPASLNGNEVILDGSVGTIKFRATQIGDWDWCYVSDTLLKINVGMPDHLCTDCDGSVLFEKWVNIPGGSVADIPLNTLPDFVSTLDSLEIPINTGDNYGVRLSGFICAPYSADYLFFISSDDNGEFWLSTDTIRENKRLIAHVPHWTHEREWYKFPEQKSDTISLTGGQKYYFEALMKEEGGGDNLAIKWKTIYGVDQIIKSEFLSMPCQKQEIVFAPQTVQLNDSTFQVVVSSTSGLPVILELVSGSAKLNGDTITLLTNRSRVTLRARQFGNETYCTASEIVYAYMLNRGSTALMESAVSANNITIYPNPADEKITIRFDEPHQCQQIIIYDMHGRLVYSKEVEIVDSGVKTIHIGGLTNGIYVISFIFKDDVVVKKFTKQ